MTIQIDQIRTDGGTQPRAQIDWGVVMEYAADMGNGATFPPVVVFYDGADYWLADGFHRLEAAKTLGLVEINADVRQGTRRDAVLFSVSANAAHGLRRKIQDIERSILLLKDDAEWSMWPQSKIAGVVKCSQATVSRVLSNHSELSYSENKIVTRGDQTYVMNVAGIGQTRARPVEWLNNPATWHTSNAYAPQPTPAPTYDPIERERRRQERLTEISANNRPLDTGGQTYPVIYADPPWSYDFTLTDNRAIENHYPTMTIDEICALPVANVAAPDCALFLWATSPKLPEAMRVIEAWGFTYKTCMVWVKDKIGMGYYARQKHELLLIATRGDIPPPGPSDRPDSVIEAPRLEHSAKPTEFYEAIERMYPTLDKIEMFSRTPREGWQAWGNQVGETTRHAN